MHIFRELCQFLWHHFISAQQFCGPPPSIQNTRNDANPNQRSFSVGTAVTYQCSTCFLQETPVTIRCQSNGQWNPSRPNLFCRGKLVLFLYSCLLLCAEWVGFLYPIGLGCNNTLPQNSFSSLPKMYFSRNWEKISFAECTKRYKR